MEVSFSDLRLKDVVNVSTGVKYGRISDMIIDRSGKNVLGLVVPTQKHFLRPNDELFVPWGSIVKLGEDVILVEMNGGCSSAISRSNGCDNSRDGDFIN